jgi:hypothetical protein
MALAGELPKEEGVRQKLLEEARYYEARELVRVLSGQIERHATIGPINMEMSATEDRFRNLFAQHRNSSELEDPLLTMRKVHARTNTFPEPSFFSQSFSRSSADARSSLPLPSL